MRWTTILLTGLLVAGCTGTDKDDDEGPTREAPLEDLELPWTLTDCQAVVVLFDVPAEAVRPHLPPGFEPVSVLAGLTGNDDPASDGSFGLEMFTCASGSGLNGTVEPIAYGSQFAFVDPPENVTVAADYQFYKWEVLVPDADRREALAARGAPAMDGSADFALFMMQEGAGTFDGTLVLGNGTYAFEGRTLVPNPDPITFTEYMAVPGGIATWHTSVAVDAAGIGTGTVDVPEGTLAAEVLGPGAHDGSALVGRWSFTDGRVHVPA